MRPIKAKFEGEILLEADDLDSVKGWLEVSNPDLTDKEYVKITKIEEVK